MKTMKLKKWASTALAAASLLALSQNASAIPVDLELSLVIDVSGSIDAGEFDLQRQGYADAFTSGSISSFIQDLGDAGTGGIAVNVIFFSTTSVEKIGWTQLITAADSVAFGNSIAGLNRTPPSALNTNIANGMALSTASFNNNFEGNRLTMDVSGDGKQNTDLNGNEVACDFNNTNSFACISLVTTQRDAASADGITVNGLTIGNPSNLVGYYNNYVRTNDGFVITANDFADFGNAAFLKIEREIKGDVPEPTIIALLGLGLAGIGFSRKQRRNS